MRTPEQITEEALLDQQHYPLKYFRHPYIPGTTVCTHCNHTYHEHGWVDIYPNGITICPSPSGSFQGQSQVTLST